MSATDSDVETFDPTRTLRDVAQYRLRRTTTIGEALYHQATAKAAALAILAEFPDAAFLELETSDQEGSNFAPGAILAADGAVIAEDSFGSTADSAVRWNNVMGLHYGPLTDLPDEFVYDAEAREAVPPYPWLVTVGDGERERIGRLDLRTAAEIDLTDAVSTAFPTETAPDLPRHPPGRQLTGEEVAALAIDAVMVPAAIIDTGARHHVELPRWPTDLDAPEVTGGRTSDGITHLTVTSSGSDVLTVRGTWNGERYDDEYTWTGPGRVTLAQEDQVEAWTRAAWVRLTDALDQVVDHAVTATLDPILARIATDSPTASADIIADLAARGIAAPSTLPEVPPASPTLAQATRDLPVGSTATLRDLDIPELPGLTRVTLHKASENAFTVDAVVVFTTQHLNELLTAACGLDVDFAPSWIADNREALHAHVERRYQARWLPSPVDAEAAQVRMTVTGVSATAPTLAVGDHLYGDPNVRAFLDEHHSGRLWRDLAAATGLPISDATPEVDDTRFVFARPEWESPHPSGPAA